MSPLSQRLFRSTEVSSAFTTTLLTVTKVNNRLSANSILDTLFRNISSPANKKFNRVKSESVLDSKNGKDRLNQKDKDGTKVLNKTASGKLKQGRATVASLILDIRLFPAG